MKPLPQLLLSSFHILPSNLSAVQTGSGSLDFPHWYLKKFPFLMVSRQVAWPLTRIQGRWSSERWQERAGCVPLHNPWQESRNVTSQGHWMSVYSCFLGFRGELLSHCFLWVPCPHTHSHILRGLFWRAVCTKKAHNVLISFEWSQRAILPFSGEIVTARHKGWGLWICSALSECRFWT